MGKLSYIYGTMNSAKTTAALTSEHCYRENGRKTIILKPNTDIRDGKYGHLEFGPIKSRLIRTGPKALYLEPTKFSDAADFIKGKDIVFVDEVQFLSKKDVWWLSDIVDGSVTGKSVPVVCYGLKTDAEGNLFEGSEAMLAVADELEERRSVCSFCGKRATMHIRTSGEVGLVGAEGCEGNGITYKSVCRSCFKKYQKGLLK